jgi:hypothetical protein
MSAAVKAGSTWVRMPWPRANGRDQETWILRDEATGESVAFVQAFAESTAVWEFGTIGRSPNCHGVTVARPRAEVMEECEVTLADTGYTLAQPVGRPD